ncbi:unnamed protein product [Blepharisma stoltei]|uniref:Uncharacterized protein n=1 Tax=Blepharisma stoltei TaxID=1481888 RepID=A0AAU9J8C7_9CILI|nr:unnamed protein product [Blepharisma stoltei]
MQIFRQALLFSTGAIIGLATTWNLDKYNLWYLKEVFRLNNGREFDYLSIPSPYDKSLEERRETFRALMEKNGASHRVVQLIGDLNVHISEYKSQNQVEDIGSNQELEMLEVLFRKYYPELFDEKSGAEFVASLKLKLHCDDHLVPKLLKVPN